MAKYLIVNADDFGYTERVTQGITEAHKSGIVTSTSLMVDADYAVQAAELAKKYKKLGLGLHFVLKDEKNVKNELGEQFKRFCELTGEQPTHIDSHQHTHLDDKNKEIFVEFAKKHKIPLRQNSEAIYNGNFYGHSYDENWNHHPLHENIGLDNLKRIIQKLPSGITELCCHPGHFTPELNDPYNKEREIELAILTDPSIMLLIKELNIRLINFAEIPK